MNTDLNPAALATCPSCNGTTREFYTGDPRYASIIAGYVDGTVPCTNCGGQYMYSTATGKVPLNRSGEPCLHSYVGLSSGEESRRGYHRYECKNCGDRYTIDSGD